MRMQISLLCFLLSCCLQFWVVSDPILHVLVQFPLLIASGYVLPKPFQLHRDAVIPVLILALFAAAIWMLPRSLDHSLEYTSWNFAKFITLPLIIGFPLSLVWPVIGPVLRGFLKAQFISMLLFLSFLYTHAPIRICNSYLVVDQYRLGMGFSIVALGLAFWWVLQIFVGRSFFSTTDHVHGL